MKSQEELEKSKFLEIMAPISITITPATPDAKGISTTMTTNGTSQPQRNPDLCCSLGNVLFKGMNFHPEEKNFLTLHCLRKLLPAPIVKKYLEKYFEEAKKEKCLPENANMQECFDLICAEGRSRDNLVGTNDQTYIRLFASLALIDKGTHIFSFVDKGICDQKLPILTDDDLQPCIYDWKVRDQLDFSMYNWRLSVPFLAYGEHREFPTKAIMPFIGGSVCESDVVDSDYPEIRINGKRKMETKGGGFGDVYFVKIHPKSHNFRGVFGPVSTVPPNNITYLPTYYLDTYTHISTP
ncbi:hypothetical protein F4774DRAFT_95319 [Daldinia eschscholtzii]|nr:hypothetical protein F4774DRAFT_95319 [Daldinia eschscholtzii]